MKKTSLLARILLLILSLTMVLATFSACAEEPEEPKATKEEATEDVVTEEGFQKDNLPDDLNFNKEVKILAGAEQNWHIGSTDAMKGNVIGEAIYARNATVEDRLGIEIKFHSEENFDWNTEQVAFMQKVENDVKGSGEYDCVISYNLLPYPLTLKNCLANLATTKYIDLEGPWWPSAYLDQMVYQGQIYGLVNNSGKGSLENISAIFFNNKLLEQYHLESPYDLVENNEWTAAKLREMIKGTWVDKSGDGKPDEKDQFGLSTSTRARLTCWYVGMGVRLADKDSDGNWYLAAGELKTGEVIGEILNLFNTDDSMLVDPLNGSNNNFAMFTEERCLFYLATLYMGEYCANNNLTINYGVVPIPKYNSEQTRYYSHMPNNHPVYYIPVTADNMDCSSAFVECMASEAYRQVAPVYYENCIKLRYAPDERLADMYDLVRASISFDMVYLFQRTFPKNCNDHIIQCIESPNNKNWATEWNSIGTPVSTKFDEIIAYYDAHAPQS